MLSFIGFYFLNITIASWVHSTAVFSKVFNYFTFFPRTFKSWCAASLSLKVLSFMQVLKLRLGARPPNSFPIAQAHLSCLPALAPAHSGIVKLFG